MHDADRDQQTICAVSTPPGYGGISVLRVSGAKAYQYTYKIAQKLPEKPESHRVYLTLICDEQENPIDEVLVSYFQNGKSFTGEEVVEISCHGNPQICENILAQLIRLGAKPADRGEFTYRAFMNNKLDLVQAESVLSLIESQSKKARSLALRQLKGVLSEKITAIEDKLVWCLAHLEASIDFSTEGLEVISDKKLLSSVEEINSDLSAMVDSYRHGKILKDGLRVALVGRPNVGKSSLLNFLCGEQKAIVTAIAGTTRDLIEARVLFEGIQILFVDTAGLRIQASDEVEKIGISKSRETIQDADLIVFVFDLEKGLLKEDLAELKNLPQERLLIIGNKADLVTQLGISPASKIGQEIQALKRLGITENCVFGPSSIYAEKDKKLILQRIFKFSMLNPVESHAVLSQLRHFEGLNKALQSIVEAKSDLKKSMGSELVAIHLKQALLSVQEVLGKHFDDQILDRVFKEFCLGK